MIHLRMSDNISIQFIFVYKYIDISIFLVILFQLTCTIESDVEYELLLIFLQLTNYPFVKCITAKEDHLKVK